MEFLNFLGIFPTFLGWNIFHYSQWLVCALYRHIYCLYYIMWTHVIWVHEYYTVDRFHCTHYHTK